MVAIPLLILLSALANFKVVHTKFQQDRTIITKTGFGRTVSKKYTFSKTAKWKKKKSSYQRKIFTDSVSVS